ncbi:DEAD/DEAH box helicase [Flavobacterium sp. MDT1-60]|uniref:DEAD/DEAH box helicase n=1 Tax=Flavobacterium sp. MDT1-60 TaxID=1979344 RepID=UPI00177F5492|nr:DEAD/DEAH box helicase [Flavobacterium sp. MDT1-60]QOG02296.1 DEAD/DEAH box helicase [Flavobacterium sp. MDT1-60]
MEELIENIEIKDSFNLEETFEVYKLCSQFIVEDEQKAQKIIINVLNNRNKFDKKLDLILSDLVEAVGFYPYLKKENLSLESTDSLIRKEYHYSNNVDKFLHEDQKHLLSLLNSEKNVIVSAPTSFGKSLLIEEFVASRKFKNIIIIQPTLALLDETRRKLLKYDEFYKIIVRTSQEASIDKGNLFLFTAERVNEYKSFPNIDFLIIDEFYKLSTNRDDERADSLNNAFHYIIKKFNSKFYLLGPNIDGISDGFVEKYNAIFYVTKSSLVDTKVFDYYTPNKEIFEKTTHHLKKGYKEAVEFKEKTLFDLLISKKNEQTIIYCSSPNRVRSLSMKFCKYLIENGELESDVTLDIIEWIKENISENWSLIKLLNNKIGIHDGALQKHITTSIIDYFNNEFLNFLFCTTTIIEGVNTSAKNIIFYDSTKGRNTAIDFFDYSNIKGRAGRLMIHYKGNIYNFNPIPKNTQIIIDIPFFEQNPISDEILINLDQDEVKDIYSDQYKSIVDIPYSEKEVIKNNGVHVSGQRSIIEQLRNDIISKYNIIAWNRYPNKEQLSYVLELAWNNLRKESETGGQMTLRGLITVTQIYGYNQSIWNLVENTYSYLRKLNINQMKSDEEVRDDAIMQSFQTLKHWFEYKVPKWLAVINSLQEFVCNEKGLRSGNYSYFSSLIENDFLADNLTILAEFGVPSSAIRKLEKLLPPHLSQDEVIKRIKEDKIYENPIFINYERNKLINN